MIWSSAMAHLTEVKVAELWRTTVRWLAVGLLITSCGDSSESNEGGQTGSLTPPSCEQAASDTFVVPEGRTALLEGHHELSSPTLRDAAGNVIATTLTRHEGAVLVQTSGPLPAGDYTLTYECGEAKAVVERDIHVSEAAPLPSTFGKLEWEQPAPVETCEHLEFITLRWTPPPEFLPYLNLTQLALSIDGVERGALDLFAPDTAETVLVHVPHCRHFTNVCGLRRGAYVLHATISDHSERWVSPDVMVDVPCLADEETGCSLQPGKRSESLLLCLGGMFALGAIRMRRYGL